MGPTLGQSGRCHCTRCQVQQGGARGMLSCLEVAQQSRGLGSPVSEFMVVPVEQLLLAFADGAGVGWA